MNHQGKVLGRVGKEFDLPLRGLKQQRGGRGRNFLSLMKSVMRGLVEDGRREGC